MEVLAVATTQQQPYARSAKPSIFGSMNKHFEKEALLSRIASCVLQTHNVIIVPFPSTEFKGTGEAQLSNSIRCLGDILQRTKGHLVAWNYKRSQKLVAFLNPRSLLRPLHSYGMMSCS